MSIVGTSETPAENENNLGVFSLLNKIPRKERFIVLAIFMVLVVVFGVFITREVYASIKSHELEAENLAIFLGAEIERECMHTFALNEIIATLLFAEEEILVDFPILAKHLLPDYPAASCIHFAPDGIVSQVYPLEGNEALLGRNVFMGEKSAEEALFARNEACLVVCGPCSLLQGGTGFIACLPVFLDDAKSEFWGFINVDVLVEDIFKEKDFSTLEKHGYKFSIYKVDDKTKEKIHIYGNPYESLHKPVSLPITIPNTNWEIALAPEDMWMDLRLCIVLVVMSLLLILAFFFLAILVVQQYVNNRKLAQLAIIDPVTGLYTRQQAVHTLENEIANAEHTGLYMGVCFIDMNGFKEINDTFGHTMGDDALRWVADRLKELALPEDIVARFGGDEFILIFRGQETKGYLDMAEKIRKAINASALLGNGIVVDVSAAVGVSVFPDNGKTVEELIQYADNAMYREKALMKVSIR
ncbi:MAG: sensor domain-containing diguanylate cyclase [Treponemataceae bacterium]|nr:sensor domain-containing diguanylate cyclase [Treponemataceae bacterium]